MGTVLLNLRTKWSLPNQLHLNLTLSNYFSSMDTNGVSKLHSPRRCYRWSRHLRCNDLRWSSGTRRRLSALQSNSQQASRLHLSQRFRDRQAQLWRSNRKRRKMEEGEERKSAVQSLREWMPDEDWREAVHWTSRAQQEHHSGQSSSESRLSLHSLRWQGDSVERLWSPHRKLKSFSLLTFSLSLLNNFSQTLITEPWLAVELADNKMQCRLSMAAHF